MRTRSRTSTVTAAVVLAVGAASPPLVAQAGGADGARLVVPLAWEPGSFGPQAPRTVSLTGEPPADAKLPTGLDAPLFGELSFGDGELLVVLDANRSNPRLWVDRDFDRDLAEERTTRMTSSGAAFTRAQVVLAPYSDQQDPAPLELRWSLRHVGEKPMLTVGVQVHRRGTAVIGGRLRLVAAVDGDGDGRFDDAARDRVYVDLDGDGDLQVRAGYDERVTPGEPFRVGDEGWTARVAVASGRLLELERSATLPPPRAVGWPKVALPAAGVQRPAPKETADELLARLERERAQPYAQRLGTVNLLGGVGTAAAFDALAELAERDADQVVRGAALRALGNPAFLAERGDRLAALARAADDTTAYSLAQALYYAGHPARDELFAQMVASGEPALLGAAARWLAYSGSERAREVLLAAFADARTPAARYSAYVQGLRSLPEGPPVDVALRAARDDYGPLRAQAIRDLRSLGHADALSIALAVARQRDVDAMTAGALCEVLGAAGTEDAVAAMLGLLEHEHLLANVRKEVVAQLRFVRAPASVAVLVAALGDKQPVVRAVAAEVLAPLAERDVTAALLKRAKREKDDQVLPLLLEALGDHGDAAALSTLVKYARSREPEIRNAAVRGLARLGFHHDKVTRFFLSMLDSKEWVDRVLALDAARSAHQTSLLPKVGKSLAHDRWQVRLAAVEAMDSMRERDAVRPLIDRLRDEPERRVRDAIAGALFRLTGVNGFDNVEIWETWWADNGKTFAVPDEVPELPDRSAGGTGAAFYGIPISSERVVFLIDQSGSMSAMGEAAESYRDQELNRLQVAVRETLGALTRMHDRARVNVVFFHSTIHPWEDKLQKLGSKRKVLQRELESKQPTGGTNIYDGLELALRMDDVDTIFLLSDGAPGQGKFVATPDILRAVRRENQTRRIAIHCVAIGMESELLKRLAAENGGRYVRR